MTSLDTAHERIQAICEKIRVETLDPARQQAEKIIQAAEEEAKHIREQAQKEASNIRLQAKKELEEEKQIFTSSLEQASRQTIELLKQKIECMLFNPALEDWIVMQMNGPKLHAKLIEVIIQAIEKDGVQTRLDIKIPQAFTADAIVKELSSSIMNTLKNGSIDIGTMKAGIQVTLKNRHITLDISDAALRELVASFIRKDFRKVFFIDSK